MDGAWGTAKKSGNPWQSVILYRVTGRVGYTGESKVQNQVSIVSSSLQMTKIFSFRSINTVLHEVSFKSVRCFCNNIRIVILLL